MWSVISIKERPTGAETFQTNFLLTLNRLKPVGNSASKTNNVKIGELKHLQDFGVKNPLFFLRFSQEIPVVFLAV